MTVRGTGRSAHGFYPWTKNSAGCDELLLIRPDNDEPWLFLSRTNHTKIDDEATNLAWKRHSHPEYEETRQHRAVTSRCGRHRFTTFWRVEQDVNRELIKYMRGDTSAGGTTGPAGGIDH